MVAPYAWGADEGTVVIASELITGGSLAALTADYGPLSEGTVATVLDQVLAALEAVHRAGIIHRDVTPGNVLLRATGHGPLDLALVDFGIALSRDDARLTQMGLVIGTPGYLPPEVMSGHSVVSQAHDLYALGKLAASLLTAAGAAPDRVGGDPALAATIEALTHDDPEARVTDIAAARVLLEPAHRETAPHDADGEPVEVFVRLGGTEAPEETRVLTSLLPAEPPARAAREARPARTARGVRGKRLWAIGLTAAVVLASAVLIARAVLGGTPEPTTPPPSTPATPTAPATPSTPTAPPAGQLAGDACTWLEQGDIEETEDGTLECAQDGSGYVWVLTSP